MNHMTSFIQEFKTFAVRGNVIDLAVAVVIGGAFGAIVTSLVNDVIMPMVGLLTGGIDFSQRAIAIGDVSLGYGAFLQSIVNFVIIAFVIFLAVRAINTLKRDEEAKPTPTPSEEILLLREIRDSLKK